jgi:hypothetical protein
VNKNTGLHGSMGVGVVGDVAEFGLACGIHDGHSLGVSEVIIAFS